MTKYVAFLRAINLGRNRVVKMGDLKKHFESFDCSNVITHINTGNVIFERKPDAKLESKIEAHLEKALQFKSEIFLRSFENVQRIAAQTFFSPEKGETLHISFIRQPVEKKLEQELLAFKSDTDDFLVHNAEVYNLRRDKNTSKFSNQFIEKKLKTEATTRNWNTICKIVEKFG